MKQHSPGFRELYDVWMRIRNKMNVMENIPRDFGAGVPLHLSEIHTIQAIGSTPENNIRIIADILGVTPSAASQTVSRLTKHGLVIKVRGKKNEKEVALELTERGRAAFANHEQVHESMYGQIADEIGPLGDHDREVLDRVFSAIEIVYDRRIRDLAAPARDGRGSA